MIIHYSPSYILQDLVELDNLIDKEDLVDLISMYLF